MVSAPAPDEQPHSHKLLSWRATPTGSSCASELNHQRQAWEVQDVDGPLQPGPMWDHWVCKLLPFVPATTSSLVLRTPDILTKRIPKGLWVPENLSSLEERRETYLGPRTTHLMGPQIGMFIPIFQVGKHCEYIAFSGIIQVNWDKIRQPVFTRFSRSKYRMPTYFRINMSQNISWEIQK